MDVASTELDTNDPDEPPDDSLLSGQSSSSDAGLQLCYGQDQIFMNADMVTNSSQAGSRCEAYECSESVGCSLDILEFVAQNNI